MTETPDLAALAERVGAAIRAQRRARRLHVTDCARAVGVHRNHWHRWENGTRPISLAQLGQVARALDVSIAELVTPAAQTQSRVLPEPYTGPWFGIGDDMTINPEESR